MITNLSNIRAGVIGVGSMGQNHARLYKEMSNLVGVADSDESQSQKVARRYGVKSYKDYEKMLSEVDAVSIAVPTKFHLEVAKKAAEAGVHILVEKPLAATVPDAEAIINIAAKHNVTLAVGHVERHSSVIELAKKSIVSNEWGELLTLTAKRFSNFPTRIHDVGVLFDLTIHDVDVICSLVNGKVQSVFAAGGKFKNKEYEDQVCLIMEFERGQKGICETNWLTPMKVRELNITTTSCYINIDHLAQEINISSSSFGEIDESNLYQPPINVSKDRLTVEGEEPLKNELLDFLEAISRKKQPLVNGFDGLQAVKIVQAGLDSIRTGSVIKLK